MEGVRRILGVGSTRWLSETFLSLSLSLFSLPSVSAFLPPFHLSLGRFLFLYQPHPPNIVA